MGRRGITVGDQGRWVFNRLAQAYRARPGYPDALVDRLAKLAGGPGAKVADLGAGNGLLAIPLAQRGLQVSAVEPAHAMLDELAERVAKEGLSGIELVQGSAEQTGLAPARFDLVLLADALQWVDPELTGAEAARLVRGGGVVALVETRLADTPFLRELEGLLAQHNPKARQPKPGAATQLLSLATGKAQPFQESFSHEVQLSAAEFEQVLRSLSFVAPAVGPARLEALLARAGELASRHGGARWRRELTLTFASHRL